MSFILNLIGICIAAYGTLLFMEVVLESYRKPLPQLTSSQKRHIFFGMVLVFVGFKLNELLAMAGVSI